MSCCVAAATFTHTAPALAARHALRSHRLPVTSAKVPRHQRTVAYRRSLTVCDAQRRQDDNNEEEDFKTSPPRKPEEENFKPPSELNFEVPPSDPGLNFQLPADLDASNFSSNVSGGAQPSPGGSRNRVRSVSWSSLEELSTVRPGKHVYILVFGAGSGSEGVYSLQERTREDVPVDIILAFPTYEDASRYSTLLEAEMGRVPIVEAALPEDLMYTCQEGGYKCKVARHGVLLVPPEKTVAVTDWERANALRDGQWTVAQDGEEGCAVFAGQQSEPGTATSTRDCQEEEEEDLVEEIKAEAQTFDVEASRAMLSRLYDMPGSPDQDDPTI